MLHPPASSKPLSHDDSSGFYFAQEMLAGDRTAGINFDRLQYHPQKGFIIFEYLLCEAQQTVTPHTSHPSKYWHKNSRKFISLWMVAQKLDATLYLVNYAKQGTTHADKILVIRVDTLDEKGIQEETLWKTSRANFQQWFRKLNAECL